MTEEIKAEIKTQGVSEVKPEAQNEQSVDSKEKLEVGSVEYTKNVRKQIDKLTREKYDAVRKANILESKYKKLEADINLKVLESQRPERPQPSQYENDIGEVDNNKYNKSLSEYEDKLLDWGIKKSSIAASVKNEPDNALETIEEYDKKYSLFKEQAEELKAKYKDFDEVTGRNVFTQAMREAILEGENQAEIAYVIGNSAEMADKLKKLTGVPLAKEIARLDIQINTAKQAGRSNAPEPITPVSGSGRVSSSYE